MDGEQREGTTMGEQTGDVRGRIGRVGVWSGVLGASSYAQEREAAAEIERLGFGALWINEIPNGKEALAHAGLLLAATERIVVGTGIANVYARDATAMRTGAEALGEAYPGRFLLGIGISHAPVVAARGHDYGRPVSTMRAYLDAMDAAQYGAPPAPEPVPVVIGALRQRMLELSRDRTDGAHPYFTPPEHTARARAVLGQGPLLAPEQTVVIEPDPELGRAAARRFMGRYLRLPNYVNNLRELGFDDDDFADGGSDRLVDAIVAWGDVEAIAARVREHHEAGADHVAVQPLSADLDGQLEQLRALAPVLLGAEATHA
jgi:probable F420-dependent oxidoreductase